MKTRNHLTAVCVAIAALGTAGTASATDITSEFNVTIRIKPVCEVNTESGGTEVGTTAKIITPITGANDGAAIPTPAGADIDFGEHFSNKTGNIDAASAASATGIKVQCSRGTTYQIALSPQTDGTANGTGNMKGIAAGNNDKIGYALFQDAARSSAWGNTWGTGGNTVSKTVAAAEGFSTVQNHPVYGRVVTTGGNIDKTPGRYADKVTVTVRY